MASKGNSQPGERSKVRFVFVEFDGASGDLQQIAQTLANAVRQQPVVVNAPALPPAKPTASLPAGEGGNPGLFDGDAEIEEEDRPDAPPRPPAAKRSAGVRKKLKTPSPVPGLEFASGAKSLKDYMEEQSPRGNPKKYLAITQWLKEYRAVEEVGADYVYTCYRALGWTVPDDVLSVFRSLKKQAWVEDGSGPGLYKINHIGEGQLKNDGQ